MESFVQGLFQGLVFMGALGLMGLPFLLWRRPPEYYWRCPRCRARNKLDATQCHDCELRPEEETRFATVRADWTETDLIAIYLIARLASFIAGALMLGAMGMLPESGGFSMTLQPEGVWTLELTAGAVFTLLVVWIVTGRFRWTLGDIGLHGNELGRNILIGIGAGVGVFLVAEAYETVVAMFPAFGREREVVSSWFPAYLDDSLWILILPATLILDPLGHEIFFRGLVYRSLRARWSMAPALLATGILFAVSSFSLLALVPLTLLGFVSGYLFERRRSLVPCLVASGMQSLASLVWLLLKSNLSLWN